MRKLYRKLISYDKFGLLRVVLLLALITIVVFWSLYSIVDSHTAERCKNRLKEESDLVAVRFEGMIEADIQKLNIAVSLLGEYSSLTGLSYDDLETVRETTGFSDVFILNSDGSITGSAANDDMDYSSAVSDVFRGTAGAVCIKKDDEYEIVVFAPLFEGRTALIGVADIAVYTDSLAMKGTLFADEVALIDNSTGDIILQCEKDGMVNLFNTGNAYNNFKKWNFISNNDSESLGLSIQNGRAEKFEYKNEEGDIRYGSISPLANCNWSVMLTMSGGVINTQSYGFMQDLVIVVVFLTMIYMVIMIASMMIIIRKSKESEAIMMQYRVAELANEAKTNFMSNMSHDIRTPLNAIVGLADICEMNADNPERVRDCISKQKAASEHLMTLINDVLDMSRIESGKVVIGSSEFDIGKQIHGIVLLIQRQMDEKNLDFKISVFNMYHEKVLGDVQRINRVLLNIISNAIKYTNAGGRVGIVINEKKSEKEGYSEYEYIISDTGIGMTQEFIKKIFVPFERMQDSTVSQIEGAGLGMTIANDLVSKMGGSIDVQSTIGQGTTVTVSLTLKYVEDNTKNDQHVEDCKNKYVVIVDDDPDLVEWMYRLVLSFEMKCVATTSCYEAINRVKELVAENEIIAFMIIGWKMPKMDGDVLAQELRKAVGNDIPILMQTAYATDDVEKDIRKAGINKVFVEPILRNDFLGIINDISSGGSESKLQIPDFSGRRILLVEDHKVNAEIVTEYLNYTGIDVEVVYDGTEAVECMSKATDGYYDLILMDIRMPKMNGYDATRKIRAMRSSYTSSVPIIALSANAFIEDRKMSEEVGMNGHLAKPVKYDEIYEELKKWFK